MIILLTHFITLKSFAYTDSDIDKILEKIEKNLAPNNYMGLYQFTNTKIDKTTTQYEIRFRSKDVDHNHGYFLKPERDKGREILRVDDSLWSYLPSVGRAVRIADRDSFAGGDFSNADVLRVDWRKQYNAKLLKETKGQLIIELVAKNEQAPYAKMRLWVDKFQVQPIQQYFYDSNDILLKKCNYGTIKTFGSVTRPAHLMMQNVITKQQSELIILDLKLKVEIPESLFVVDNMGKVGM